MDKKNCPTHRQYFELKEESVAKYGNTTVVLMEVGDFYEIYGLSEDKDDMNAIAKCLQMKCTQKNKAKNLPISISQPYMIGFPVYMIDEYMKILVEAGRSVVRVDQMSHGEKNPDRKIVDVVTKGTYLDAPPTVISNYMMAVHVNLLKSKNMILYSFAAVDLLIGKTIIFEHIPFTINSDKPITDDIVQFIDLYNPVELILSIDKSIDKDSIESILPLKECVKRTYIRFNYKISYQKKLLSKIFDDTGLLDPIEYLQLERLPELCKCYCGLLDYAYSYNKNIIKRLNKPEFWEKTNSVMLNNNSLYQLNIVSHEKGKCLLDIMIDTSTMMGKRLFKMRLLNPIINIKELESRYDKIEQMMDTHGEIEKILKRICDLDRIHRKISLGRIEPYELSIAIMSYIECIKLFDCKGSPADFSKDFEKGIRKFVKDIKKTFNVEELSKLSNLKKQKGYVERRREFTIKGNIFKDGIAPELDEYADSINKSMESIKKIHDRINNQFENGKDVVYMHRDVDGVYYFETTSLRYNKIKKYLKDRGYKAEKKSSAQNSAYRISGGRIDKLSKSILNSCKNIDERTKEIFHEKIKWLDRDCLWELSEWVAEIDVIKSCCKSNKKYGYCRPVIKKKVDSETKEINGSYIDAKQLRHPIIERILDQTTYIPNDIQLGHVLLYGANGCGKSSLMKSLGLTIFLAQSGMFVPCKEFTYYPFKKIFTRIRDEDNIYKAESSFTIEMKELGEIMNGKNKYSLVLGDELCKGTESNSAVDIVNASLKILVRHKIPFLFATHLHELTENGLENIDVYHLSVTLGKTVEYHRKINAGQGPQDYGVDIAKFIINDHEFIKELNETRKYRQLVSKKESRYNPNVYVDECQICGVKENLDVHHIKFQKNCNEYGLVDHIRKNMEGNLCVLCKKHHQELHAGKYEISGYIKTSKGIVLDWKVVEVGGGD